MPSVNAARAAGPGLGPLGRLRQAIVQVRSMIPLRKIP
ncbi:hypothetical protein OICFNHDK_3666 [Methylobacterium bullatum]|uniref:Uncharacterized protein n=1 Tax=Methylobacterium bullatum TaxID=570505 RepID=A0A679KBB0_9HYPH|nr:hypothetical protein OICFNHDK_3666 [Methylobacterium bullatum]CAA2144349.1 hypothetical protein MBLL_03472 [Methylobacterium bullatum]